MIKRPRWLVRRMIKYFSSYDRRGKNNAAALLQAIERHKGYIRGYPRPSAWPLWIHGLWISQLAHYMADSCIACKRVANMCDFIMQASNAGAEYVTVVITASPKIPSLTKGTIVASIPSLTKGTIVASSIIATAPDGQQYIAYASTKQFNRRYRYGPAGP